MIDNAELMDVDESFSASPGRSLMDRIFHKVRKGSLRGAIFNLCCIAIGAGCLTLPYAFNLAGIGAGTILLLIGACFAYWSLNNLVLTSKAVKSRSYMVVCEKATGKWLGKAIEIVISIYLFGILILLEIMGNFINSK